MQRLARAFLYDLEIVKDLFFFTEAYSDLSQKSKMELFVKIANENGYLSLRRAPSYAFGRVVYMHLHQLKFHYS